MAPSSDQQETGEAGKTGGRKGTLFSLYPAGPGAKAEAPVMESRMSLFIESRPRRRLPGGLHCNFVG